MPTNSYTSIASLLAAAAVKGASADLFADEGALNFDDADAGADPLDGAALPFDKTRDPFDDAGALPFAVTALDGTSAAGDDAPPTLADVGARTADDDPADDTSAAAPDAAWESTRSSVAVVLDVPSKLPVFPLVTATSGVPAAAADAEPPERASAPPPVTTVVSGGACCSPPALPQTCRSSERDWAIITAPCSHSLRKAPHMPHLPRVEPSVARRDDRAMRTSATAEGAKGRAEIA